MKTYRIAAIPADGIGPEVVSATVRVLEALGCDFEWESYIVGAEAVALLPPFARSMLGLERPGLAAFPARAATWGMGKTLRWAFRQS